MIKNIREIGKGRLVNIRERKRRLDNLREWKEGFVRDDFIIDN